MRRIAPIFVGTVTAVLILFASAIPAVANAGGGLASAGWDQRTTVTVIHPPAGTAGAFGISAGPGGVWFSHGATLDRVTASGVEEFPMPDPMINTGTLAWKPGGPLWFADRATSKIGSIDGSGHVRTYAIPHPAGGLAVPQGIVVGPGPAVWFTDQVGGSIDRLNTRTGATDVHPLPTPAAGPHGMTRGSDGALWFVERLAAKVGRMTADGAFTEWPLAPGAFPNRITTGPDRAIWFTELNAGKLGRIDRAGRLTEYPITGGPVGITSGPGRALYVSLFNDKALARVNTAGRVTGRWDLPEAAGPTQAATIGNAVWVTDFTSDTVYEVVPRCR